MKKTNKMFLLMSSQLVIEFNVRMNKKNYINRHLFFVIIQL